MSRAVTIFILWHRVYPSLSNVKIRSSPPINTLDRVHNVGNSEDSREPNCTPAANCGLVSSNLHPWKAPFTGSKVIHIYYVVQDRRKAKLKPGPQVVDIPNKG
jgi:hypothetical protein